MLLDKVIDAKVDAKVEKKVEEKKTDGDAPDFDSMTKAQLVEYAEENGIEITKSAKVAEVRDQVKAGGK